MEHKLSQAVVLALFMLVNMTEHVESNRASQARKHATAVKKEKEDESQALQMKIQEIQDLRNALVSPPLPPSAPQEASWPPPPLGVFSRLSQDRVRPVIRHCVCERCPAGSSHATNMYRRLTNNPPSRWLICMHVLSCLYSVVQHKLDG